MYFRIKAFVLPLMMASVLMISCAEGRHSPTEADLSAFGTYVNALDTATRDKEFFQGAAVKLVEFVVTDGAG